MRKISLLYIVPVFLAGAGIGSYFFPHHESMEVVAVKHNEHNATNKSDELVVLHEKLEEKNFLPSPIITREDTATAGARNNRSEDLAINFEQYTTIELLNKLNEIYIDSSESAEKDQVLSEIKERLQKNPDPSIIKNIAELLASDTLSLERQNDLLNFLAQFGTVDAAQALISMIPQLHDEKTKEQLAQIFNNQSDLFQENASLLEQAWKDSSGDELLEPAVALAIAKIGTEDGIKLLLNSIDKDTDYSLGKNQLISKALAAANKPESIYFLGETLRNKESNQSAAYVSGYALAHNGNELAVKNLLDWASSATDEEGVMVDDWLRTALENNPSALKVIEKEVENKKFDNQSVEGIVAALLFEYSKKATN